MKKRGKERTSDEMMETTAETKKQRRSLKLKSRTVQTTRKNQSKAKDDLPPCHRPSPPYLSASPGCAGNEHSTRDADGC